jgi:TatD DNase family protein
MFSDTHCHLPLVAEWIPTFSPSSFFASLCERKCSFLLDIGTKCDDILPRISFVQRALSPAGSSDMFAGTGSASAGISLSPEQVAQVCSMTHFSAGIWPSLDAIRSRNEQMQVLEKQIQLVGAKTSLEQAGDCLAKKGVCAIGECGIDHHWNPSGVDGRCESDFDQTVFDGERELFLMQIELAKKLALPVIVHSRDAFQDTVDCIKEGGYDNGIIHCFSYSKEEAAVFLDRGWYIALGGGVTYTKKSKMDAMNELINYIPSERLLLETDAPYLAPVPFRGEPNTPLLIENTYAFIAERRGISVDKLCSLVDENAARLF